MIAHRGLTVYNAVEFGDGESIIRRNGHDGQRLVVDDMEEVGKLILDYGCYRFTPDVNLFGSECISRIPIDFDKPTSISWKNYAEFVNGFQKWLQEQGFNPRLRLTGGRGVQAILDINVDRLAKTTVVVVTDLRKHCTPFPKPLKFETWLRRFGQAGIVSGQASDLVTILALAYGHYRKSKLGLCAPLTVEMRDLSQRYWNILADSSRAVRDMGIVSVGSIHHKTGNVCLPIATVPEEPGLEHALKSSFCPDINPREFDPRYKSLWIQTVGRNPFLLHEPTSSHSGDEFSLVEEAFEKYGWIPREYVQLGSQRFMEKHCWA